MQMMPDRMRRIADRSAVWLRRYFRPALAAVAHLAATVLFPVFAVALLPVALAPAPVHVSCLAALEPLCWVSAATMLGYWGLLYAEALRFITPVLLARLRRRERRLLMVVLTALMFGAGAACAQLPTIDAARILLLMDALTIGLVLRIHHSCINAYTAVLHHLWQWVRTRFKATCQLVSQKIHSNLQRAISLIVACKLWVGASEFIESPSLPRGLLVLVDLLLLIALLLRPRTTPPPNDLAD
jgi:hypothetical protein